MPGTVDELTDAASDAGTGVLDPEFEEALRAHSAGRSLGFMFWHTTLRWQREIDAALRDLGLTHAQFALLATTWWLGRDGTAPNQRQVAEHAGVGEVMASQILKLLERNGMIVRRPSKDDVRARALSLTDQGRALAERAVVAADRFDDMFFGPVSDPAKLLEMLRTLSDRTSDGEPNERRS